MYVSEAFAVPHGMRPTLCVIGSRMVNVEVADGKESLLQVHSLTIFQLASFGLVTGDKLHA